MVKVMQKNNKFTFENIEAILESINISYEKINLPDNDINYLIQYKTHGKLKPLNSISALLYFSLENHTSNLIVMNIYKIENPEVLSVCYKIINSVNLTIAGGAFSITEGEKQQIIYRSTSNFTFELGSQLISQQLDESITAIEKLIELLIVQKGSK